MKSLNPSKQSALGSSRDSHLVVFLPSYRGVWQAAACGVTQSQTGRSTQVLLNDQYLLQGAHRGEGVWAPSSTGSFFNVLAYAEAELGLGLGSSRPVGIQGGNGQGALFIRHMLGICSGLVLHGELGGQWCRHFHGRGRGLSWTLLESLTARGVCPAGLLACLSSLSYPPCREGLTQSQLCCRL